VRQQAVFLIFVASLAGSSFAQTRLPLESAAATSTTEATGYETAVAAMRRRDYRAAYSACLEPAKTGDSRCQNIIGVLYVNGQFGTRSNSDLRIAADWFREAAKQNLASAQYNLGAMQERGIAMPRDLNAAKALYELAAAQGHANAKKALSRLGPNTAQTGTTGQGVGAPSSGPGIASTSAEAAPKGWPDVLGIKLGFSTIDEVRAALHKITPALEFEESRQRLLSMQPDGKWVEVANGAFISSITGHTRGPCDNRKGSCETFSLSLSAPPNKSVALSMQRRIDFASGPTVETVTRSLVEKYGEPGFHRSVGRTEWFTWVWSRDGNPMPATISCNSYKDQGSNDIANSQAASRRAIRDGCPVLVQVDLITSNRLVTNMVLSAINHAAIDTSNTQSLAFISSYMKDLARQEHDNAAKTIAPKF
jgi:hypothetical protein